MNNLLKYISGQPKILKVLGFIIITVILSGLFLSACVILATTIERDLLGLPLCFSNRCVGFYLGEMGVAFNIARAALDIGVAIATIGGIFVALLSYINSSENSALSNHIDHLKVFCDYLDAEIKKRERLSPSQIDTLHLYSVIFQQSRSGRTTVSDDYNRFIEGLNRIIEGSNEQCVKGTPGGFSYMDHQRKVRDLLVTVGITVYLAPRNDYLEMEGQLFSLMHRLSQSFCLPKALPAISERRYC